MATDNINLLQKFAHFTKIALAELQEKEDVLLSYQKKVAADRAKKAEYDALLKKAAQTLYDTDFICDDVERKRFLKNASENPAYALSVLIKVCNAADVALIGKPARVAARPKEAEYDPVMAKAFGWYGNNNTIIDD